MTKKLRYYLLIIAAAVCLACLCAFAGCKIGGATREEVLQSYKANVLYFANGGNFNGVESEKVSDVYFKNDPSAAGYNPAGVPFFDVTDSTVGLNVARTGYDLIGWYFPKTYDSGSHSGEIMYSYIPQGATEAVPVYQVKDENGEILRDFKSDRPVYAREGIDEQIPETSILVEASERQATSAYILADDAKLVVCAVWRPSLKVKYVLADDLVIDADTTVKKGTVLRELNFGKDSTYVPSPLAPDDIDGATFLRTYTDEACTKPATGAIPRPEGENPEDVIVYSKYIVGEWTVISNTAASVRALFAGLSDAKKQFYVMEDVKSETPVTVTLKREDRVALARVEGNGHKIENIRFNLGTSSALNDENYSPFGTLGESFVMNDITFNNITVQIKGRGNISIFGFASGCHQNATLSDVVISNVKITADIPSANAVKNAQNGDQSNILFGGFNTDAEFLAAYAGVKVNGENSLVRERI